MPIAKTCQVDLSVIVKVTSLEKIVTEVSLKSLQPLIFANLDNNVRKRKLKLCSKGY